MSQTPIGKFPMDDEARTALTQNVIKSAKGATVPPKGFEPLKASNKELAQYGFPPKPDKDQKPQHLAKWTSLISRPTTVVAPEFAIIKGGRLPAQIVNEASNITTNGSKANGATGNWSGAVVTSPAAGQAFNSVSASWIVPNAWPPLSAWTGSGWKDGSWESVAWVGIDGYSAQQSILQSGTKSVCTVTNGVVSHQSWAWFEWFPAYEIQFSNYQVSPGDTVHVTVCSTSPTAGYAIINNISANTGTSVQVSAPAPANALKGQNAEWILEDDSSGGGFTPFSDYGAEFFYDCLGNQAGASGSSEVNISNATLLNIVQGGVTLSTAVAETPTVLLTFYGNAGP